MQWPRALGLILTLALTVAGCGKTEAPKGRWEGFSESGKWMLAVRLQIDKGNQIHATALSVGIDGVSLPRRIELTRKIKASLGEQWPMAAVGMIDFKDNVITKAGGFAPLFVYEPKTGAMTFNFYAGGRLTERIKLYPVRAFAGG